MIRKLKTIFTRSTKSDEIQTLLKHRINPDDAFLDVLLRRGILLRDEIERIKSKSTLKKKNKKLLKYVFEKRRHEELIAALKEANQSDILDSVTTFQGSAIECEDDVTDDYKSHSQELVKHQLNRHSEEEDQSLSPEERQQNQEMEKLWGKSIEIHYDLIVERMSPEFGLIDRLFAHRAITSKEKNMIENKKIIQDKNKIILDCLSKNHTLEILVELLGKCDQRHLVRYLENDGIYSDGFDGDWPLTDEVISTIDCNYADLVDLLDVSDLMNHLNATGVINHRQREFISSKPTSYEKNGALLDILRRSSLRSYWQTIRCLHQTNQSHIAEILEKRGAIVRVDVHLETEGRNVNETEKEIATKINNLLSDKSSDEIDRIFDQLKLIRAKTCHSVSLYFLCNQSEEVERLEKLTKDGRLREIIESLFNRLIKTPVKIKIEFKWTSDTLSRWREMFQGQFSEKGRLMTIINRLPFEILDIILWKSYLAFALGRNKGRGLRDETFIKLLASVDLCWSKRITNRKFRSDVWTKLSRIYKVQNRDSYIYKCNRQMIEENLTQPSVNENSITVSGAVDDVEHAINTRTKSTASKNRPPFYTAKGHSVFATFRDGAIQYGEDDSTAKSLQNKGASARVEITIRDPNRTETIRQFLNRLRNLKDETISGSTETKSLLNDLKGDGIAILDSVQDRDVVVWIRCKSTNALEKLKQMNESKTLARILVQLTNVDLQSTNIDGDHLKKDIVNTMDKQKYLLQIASEQTASEWHRLIEYGVPQDKAVEWLKNEATSATAPIEYHDAWIVHNDQDIRVNNDITTAECLALRIYSNAVHKFYSKFNEDCSNCKWEHYSVLINLLRSALCKRRRKYYVKIVEMITDDDCGTKVTKDGSVFKTSLASTSKPVCSADMSSHHRVEIEDCGSMANDSFYPGEIETLIPPFRIFPDQRSHFRINSKNSLQMSPILASPLIRGSLLGAVVGNCIGGPYEFHNPSTVEEILRSLTELESGHPISGQRRYWVDTCMILALANSLTNAQAVDIEDLRTCFGRLIFDDPDRNYSSSIFRILGELHRQTKDDDHFAPAKRRFNGDGSMGNGGAMRIAALAIYCFNEKANTFNEHVRTVTALTHSHPIGINGAILQAAAVQLALVSSVSGRHSDDFGQDYVDELIRRMKDIELVGRIFVTKLEKIRKYLRNTPTDKAVIQELGIGVTADVSVPTAIYCFLRGMKPIPGIPSDRSEFERTIVYAISLGGDTDTIASMVGAIAGAYYGQDAVTQRWRDLCETKAIDGAKRYANIMIGQLFSNGEY